MSPVPVAQALREWGLRPAWYHSTPMRRRLAIQRHGLLARRPHDHNYRHLPDTRVADQPVGVYVTIERDGRWGWEACRNGERPAMFRVDPHLIGHLPVRRDELISNALIILEDVPPEALTYTGPLGRDLIF